MATQVNSYYTFVSNYTQPFAMGMANVVAPTGDMAAMGGGTQNGGSSQTFLKSGQDMGVDGAAFGNLFRKKIGINVLNLTKYLQERRTVAHQNK